MTNQCDHQMRLYYKERAPVYDAVYSYPERQNDLRFLENYVGQQFKGVDVLEVAAGTGYWTQFICAKAASVLATDITKTALDQLKSRPGCDGVSAKILDAYTIDKVGRNFGGAFAGLWYSHVPRQRADEFLSGLHQALLPGATVLFIDNSAAQCNRLPLSDTDECGNTYQDRVLETGGSHRVLKNFPTQKELLEATQDYGEDFYFLELENFWLFQYASR